MNNVKEFKTSKKEVPKYTWLVLCADDDNYEVTAEVCVASDEDPSHFSFINESPYQLLWSGEAVRVHLLDSASVKKQIIISP